MSFRWPFRWIAVFIAAACLSAGLTFAQPAAAAEPEPSDPAAKQIALFSNTLIESMKQAKDLGIAGRYNKLKPVIDKVFDLATMTRLAVGPAWATLSPQERQALVDAFERMTVANYARNFDGYDGEAFAIDPNVQLRGTDRLVLATLTSPHDKPVPFIYRMRPSEGAIKVIDIYLNGNISELATRRSDFGATMTAGGSTALVKRINALSDRLLAGA